MNNSPQYQILEAPRFDLSMCLTHKCLMKAAIERQTLEAATW